MSVTGAADPQPALALPVDVRAVTRGHSCVLCQQRKVKCDGQRPCSTCVKYRVECLSKASAPPRHRKARVTVSKEGLAARLRRCEELLKMHGLKVDSDVDAVSDTPKGQCMDVEYAHNESRFPDSATVGGKLIVEDGHSRYVENNLWAELSDEFQESKDIRPRSSDDDQSRVVEHSGEYHNIHKLIFGRPTSEPLSSSHPQPVQIFRLWQTFLDNVNPLIKLFHAPTVQQMILEASSDLDKLSKSTEALMFAIYLSAVISLTNEDCQKIMGESRLITLAKLSNATQQALINAELLKASNITILQAFTLFLLSMRRQYDPHSLWLFAGLAVRIGQRIGLHREGASRELSVFEAEMRRRLWWQIIILDFRSAQLSGTAIGADQYSHGYDTKRPLNVNDSDLNPTMKELPVEHTGITEMLFCSVRYEIGKFMRQLKTWHAIDGSGSRLNPPVSIGDKDKAIDELKNRLEEKFLRYCDPSIPLHLISSAMARSAICQMRLMAHHPRQYPDKGASLPQEEKDMLFSSSLSMIESDNLAYSTKSIQGYLWHINIYFQLDAFIYLLSELQNRVEGDMVDRAWEQVNEVYENHPEMIKDIRNALYFAIGNLALKAWEQRAEVVGRTQGLYQLATPHFISTLRSQREPKPLQAIQQTTSDNLDRGLQSNQFGQGDQNHDEVTNISFSNPTLLPSYIPTDISPADWEYWQTLLEGCELPMVDGNGQHMFPQNY